MQTNYSYCRWNSSVLISTQINILNQRNLWNRLQECQQTDNSNPFNLQTTKINSQSNTTNLKCLLSSTALFQVTSLQPWSHIQHARCTVHPVILHGAYELCLNHLVSELRLLCYEALLYSQHFMLLHKIRVYETRLLMFSSAGKHHIHVLFYYMYGILLY